MKYQYMGHQNPSPRIANLIDTDRDQAFQEAIKMFQQHWGLAVTG